MADKPKYDLSNVGGQPKDWVQRGKEYDAEFSWWDDIKFGFGPILLVAGLLACGGLAIYGLLQIAR